MSDDPSEPVTFYAQSQLLEPGLQKFVTCGCRCSCPAETLIPASTPPEVKVLCGRCEELHAQQVLEGAA